MGIQPIDLQNMYSQISNVAKNVGGQQQAAQVAQSVQQQNQIQKDMESAQRVQQTSNDKANTNNVNADGHQGSGGYPTYQNIKNVKLGQPIPINIAFGSFETRKEGYVGTIVDITR